jgi:putative chitinase
MCITGSVGIGGANRRADVKTIQVLINAAAKTARPPFAVDEDGRYGRQTRDGLLRLQAEFGLLRSGLVAPGDIFLKQLQAKLPAGPSAVLLHGVFIQATAPVIDLYADPIRHTLQRRDINTPLRMAHFLAQVGHESADLLYQEEIASGRAYEGRRDLGNTQPGDGVRFKGRGLIQLTGRSNYRDFGASRGEDFLTAGRERRVALEPELAADAVGWYWETRGINAPADRDDVRTVTRLINGGFNGLEDRKERLARAKFFLKLA